MLKEKSEVRKVQGLSKEERQRIIDFLQGAIYCWCKNRPDEWFSMRDLMGGENSLWEGTPLMVLWELQRNNDNAGKASGWLLKEAIHNDMRTFESKNENLIRKYKWIKEFSEIS